MTKSAKKQNLDRPGFGDVRFINYTLNEQQKAALKAMPYTDADFSSDLDRICDSSYKVSFSYDDYNQCYSCFFTPRDDKSVNKGLILTARGSTILKAFKQAMYLHYTLFQENWADFYVPQGREPIDD